MQETIADDLILYLDENRSQTHLAGMKGSNYPTAARKADFTKYTQIPGKCQVERIRENGIDIKNIGKTRYVIAASGKINNFGSIMAVAIEEYVHEGGRKAFYLHEVLIKNKDTSPLMAAQQRAGTAGEVSSKDSIRNPS